MRFLDRYCRTEFASDEDFRKNFKLNVPENFNFAFDVIDEIAKETPDKNALVWCNDQGEEKILTFKDISVMSSKVANALYDQGVRAGDRVLLILKRRYQFWYIMMGLHKLGATPIPATHLLTPKDVAYRVDAAEVKMVICTGKPEIDDEIIEHVNAGIEKAEIKAVKACVGGVREGYIDIDKIVEEASVEFPRSRFDESYDPEYYSLMYFTSGTTGMPKMVSHNYNYPIGHIQTAAFWQGLKPSDVHFTMSDTGWAKCAWGKLYGQWFCEAAIFVYDYEHRFPPLEVAKMIEKYKITTFCAPPTVYRFIVQENLEGIDLSSLRASFVAGEPLNPEVYNQWKKLTGLKMREGFGQTESTVIVYNSPWMEPKPGSMGRPAPGFGVTVLNDEGEPCEVGEEGEICVRIAEGIPKGLFVRYHNDEALMNKVVYDGYYHMGDQVWVDEDGYFWFIGRADDVIKSSGYRIGPFEVESALLEHPAVVETAITAVPDPVRGQVVKASIILAKGYEGSPELVKELQNHVKRVTAPYKYPRIVEFVEELPKTISGKIRRVQIRQEAQKARERFEK